MLPTRQSNHFYASKLNKYYYCIKNKVASKQKYEDLLRINSKHDSYEKYPWTNIMFHENLPISGWKIHISANLDNHIKVLKIISDYCDKHKINFKFSIDENSFRYLNSKNISRFTAGKFIVLYPEQHKFLDVIEDVYLLTKEYDGPYIVTDQVYKDSNVVYYRYGEISPIVKLSKYGMYVNYVLDKDSNLIIDKRDNSQSLKNCIKEEYNLSFPSEESIFLKKYIPKYALHFSATGGVYLVEDINGISYVAKESRKLTGIDGKNNYATNRIEREYEILKKLEKHGLTPKIQELINDCGNKYLVEEYIDGISLREFIYTQNPLVTNEKRIEVAKEYWKTSKVILQKLRKISSILESEKINIGDISDTNVIIKNYEKSEDVEIKLIDLETATYFGESKSQIYTPGYSAFGDRDRDKICVLALNMLYPISSMYELDVEKKDELLTWFSENNTLGGGEYLRVVEELFGKRINKNTLKYSVEYISEKVLKSAEFSRELGVYFPADPHIYNTNKYSIAHGVFGVIFCLEQMLKGNKRVEEIKEIAINDYINERNKKLAPSFLMGESGINLYLKRKDLFSQNVLVDDYSVFYGYSGMLIEKLLRNESRSDIEEIASKVLNVRFDDIPELGFYQGISGIVASLLVMYSYSREEKYLKKAELGMKIIEENIYINSHGNITLNKLGRKNDNKRVDSPFLYDGIAGIGYLLLLYRKITKNRHYDKLLREIANSLDYKIQYFPSLMRGLSGITDFLISYCIEFDDSDIYEIIETQISSLYLFLISKDESFGFVGEQLLRISHDFYTGTIGILAVINRYNLLKKGIKTDSAEFYLNNVFLYLKGVE